ncbi:hypothetical protein L3Y34_006219 [Caenorhabditis briggsae]|uniref:Uncharacterized protein n=1 Tax=Caenorhabditis briggsae TaxID=6238 RepID=A0AAE9CYM5_CAEBR|nr:hypothetical protein L3Y34_006219 [Caenorhabditis briggsae]
MRNIFLLFCFIFVGSSHGAPLETHGVQSNITCIKTTSYNSTSVQCSKEVNKYINKTRSFDDMKNKTRIDDLCSGVTTCLKSLSHCRIFGPGLTH